MLLSDVCSICFSKNTDEMKGLEDLWNDQLKLKDLMSYIIDRDCKTNYSRYLCSKCERSLVEAYQFKKKCIEAWDKFEEWDCFELSLKEEYQDEAEERELSDFEDEDDVHYIGDLRLLSPIQINELSDEEVEYKESKQEQKLATRTCLECKVTFSNVRGYNMHISKFHKVKMCPDCTKPIDRQNLQDHKNCKSLNPHRCDECGKTFTLIENLAKHKRIHTGDCRYECEFCGKKFVHWNSRRCHIAKYHIKNEKNFECHQCGKKFPHNANLLVHIRSHTKSFALKCPYCFKGFSRRSNLRDHLVVHTKERNEMCEICSKSFGTRKTLMTHMKIHTGERKHICPVCRKSFTQRSAVNTHLKTHPEYTKPQLTNSIKTENPQ